MKGTQFLSHLAATLLLLTVTARSEEVFNGDKNRLRHLLKQEEVENFRGIRRELAPQCSKKLEWKSAGGQILLNDKPFYIKGINWSGFESPTHVVHGLWGKATTMDDVLTFCKSLEVNAMRIPISLDLALDSSIKVKIDDCVECEGRKAWDMLDVLFDKAAKHGILILLDMHRLNNKKTSPLWYDKSHSEKDFIAGWINILKEFGSKENLLGIDLYNEPHGDATWGMGKDTDWNVAAERIVLKIVKSVPTYNKLIFIEGVSTGGATPYYHYTEPAFDKFMGQNFDGVWTTPIDFGSPQLNELLVYSPHVYGPSVFQQPYFSDDGFPGNMVEIWDMQIGFLREKVQNAVVIGEWGGTLKGADAKWHKEWVKYMTDRCFTNSFYWSLNPESVDTGGIFLDDWKTAIEKKVNYFSASQPKPSSFTTSLLSKKVCVNYGAPPKGCENVPTPTPTQPPAANPEAPQQQRTADGCALAYGQCGGQGFNKDICCEDGYECYETNEFYSQCLPRQ